MGRVIRSTRCPSCGPEGDGAGNNLQIYEDGSTFCFACSTPNVNKGEMLSGKYIDLLDRGLTKPTCEKYNIELVAFSGKIRDKQYTNERAVTFNRYKDGKLITQKLRVLSDKTGITQKGDAKFKELYGQSIFVPHKSWPIVITEGEFDAACVYQETGLAAVSIPTGAGGAAESIRHNLEWLYQWKDVILMFDNDEAGQIAIQKCLPLFDRGGLRLAKIPLKDANEMVLAGRGAELKKCLWDAQSYRPATMVTFSDIRERILKKPEYGIAWPWRMMTDVTYGLRMHELYVLAGPTAAGKTEIMKEIIFHLIENKIKVGVFSFEQEAEDTARRLLGSKFNKKLHIPSSEWWDESKLNQEIDNLEDYCYLYDNRGTLTLDDVKLNIKYMVKCYGVKFIVIDNLTAMCSIPMIAGKHSRDSEYVGYVVGQLHSLIKELDVTIMVVSHLAQDKINTSAYVSTVPKDEAKYFEVNAQKMDKFINRPGMDWETGRMCKLTNIFGYGTVSKLAHYVIGIARNRLAEDELEKRVIRVKFLKTRIDSAGDGKEFNLLYDVKTGRLNEV